MWQVRCGWCSEHIYNRTKPLRMGDVIDPRDFQPAADNIPQPKYGDKTLCPRCDGDLFWDPSGIKIDQVEDASDRSRDRIQEA